jgi:hypothetical protein
MLGEFVGELFPALSYEWAALVAYVGLPVLVSVMFGGIVLWAITEDSKE